MKKKLILILSLTILLMPINNINAGLLDNIFKSKRKIIAVFGLMAFLYRYIPADIVEFDTEENPVLASTKKLKESSKSLELKKNRDPYKKKAVEKDQLSRRFDKLMVKENSRIFPKLPELRVIMEEEENFK